MSLDLSHIYNDYFKSIEERNKAEAKYILEQFNDRLERMAKKEKLIQELTYEKNLIENDAINIMVNDVGNSALNIFRGFNSGFFWKAWKYHFYSNDIEAEDGKTLEETKASYKACLNFSKEIIERKFLDSNKKFKYSKILMNNYGEFYEFEYTYGKETLEIGIPVFTSANAKSYTNLAMGYTVRYVDGCVHHLLTYGFDIDKIKADIKAWCDKVDKEARKCRKKATNTEK